MANSLIVCVFFAVLAGHGNCTDHNPLPPPAIVGVQTTMSPTLTELVLSAVAGANFCSYELYPGKTSGTDCHYGCCYTTVNPCCSEPFYVKADFIAPMVIGSVVVIIVIAVVIIVKRKRMQAVPTLASSTTTNMGVVTYPGYGNAQYSAQPMYVIPASNTAPPAYQQQVQGSALPYGVHTAPCTTIKNINSSNNNAQILY